MTGRSVKPKNYKSVASVTIVKYGLLLKEKVQNEGSQILFYAMRLPYS